MHECICVCMILSIGLLLITLLSYSDFVIGGLFVTAILLMPNHLPATIIYCIYVYVNCNLLYHILCLATVLTSMVQLRRAFIANSLLTRQNSHLYNESSSDLTKNATENVFLRGLSWEPRKISKTIVGCQSRVSVLLFIKINREILYRIFYRTVNVNGSRNRLSLENGRGDDSRSSIED